MPLRVFVARTLLRMRERSLRIARTSATVAVLAVHRRGHSAVTDEGAAGQTIATICVLLPLIVVALSYRM